TAPGRAWRSCSATGSSRPARSRSRICPTAPRPPPRWPRSPRRWPSSLADDAALVSLNLIPKHLIRPRLIKAMAAAVVLAVAVGLLLGWLISWWVGLLVGAVIAGPVIGSSLSVLRRDQQMIGTEIVSRSTGTRTVDLAAVPARITGHRGRTSQAVLKCGGQSVVLAVYVGERGRELPIEALAALESALRRAAERNGAPA